MAINRDKQAREIADIIFKSKNIVDSIRGMNENEKIAAFQSILEYFLKSRNISSIEHLPDASFIRIEKSSIDGSFASFIRKLNARSQADKVLAAVYACLQDGRKSVTRKDIEGKYKDAFLKKSKNMSAEINSNILKGYMMPAEKIGGRKGYSITSDGIGHIENKLEKWKDKDD